MGVASSSLASPTRTKSLMVRLAPYLVEAVCELARAIKDKTHSQTEISGLLFGKSTDGLVTVEALKTFKDSSGPRSDLARRERMEKAFSAAMTLATEDPEFSGYTLLGWFSLRGGGGLINSDIEFHNQHFKHPEDVALIIWREGDTQITTELYASVENSKLTTEDYRWSSVRLSTELRHVSTPVDLVMRVRMNDDLYMRTYGVADIHEKKEEWKKMADSAKRTLLSLLPKRGESDVVYPEDLPIPAASGTAKRSFESRTLFRSDDAEPSSPIAPILPKPQPTAAPGAITRVQEPVLPAPAPVSTTRETPIPVPSFDFNRAPRPKTDFTEVSGLPMVIPKNRPIRTKSWPWLSTALVFVVFSGLTFAFMAFKTAGGDSKISQVMRVLFPGSDLELRAASHGDSLWVSWNRRNPVVSSSTGAVLSVTDGPRHFERKLDAGQVADGEVKYTPVSGDVTFQLRVYGNDQTVATGNLRVLDATAPVTAEGKAPLDLSASNTPAPPPTTTQPAAPVVPTPPVLNNKPAAAVSNNKPYVPPMTPPPIPTADSTPVSKPPAAETPKPANQPPPVVPPAPQQQAPVQTAQQPPPVTPQTSNTAINGWDPNLPENKPVPVQTPQPTQATVSDFVRPRVLLQVMPNTRSLTQGSITEVTRVEVEVRIDTSGHVKAAHLTNPNIKTQLGNAAISAAKQWTFQPATLRGQAVESDHTIAFDFTPDGR